MFRIAAPFLIGLAAGWIVARAWRRPFDLVTGCTIWVVTIAVGMVLRRTLFDRGTAFSFVIVASVFTGVLLIGWRLVASPHHTRHRIRHQNQTRFVIAPFSAPWASRAYLPSTPLV